jgi:putative membrane protein
VLSLSDLPTLNASLNALCTALLVVAYAQIRARRIEEHRRTMLAAFGTSVLFLISYVIYHVQVGSKPYPGTGVMRTVYFAILIPHVILAATVVPLALLTLRRGLRRDDKRHRAIAGWTLPIWLFVSVTGVIVYLMLYWFRPA